MSIYFVLMINTNKIKKEITYFHVNIDIFSSIATTLYGYICHQLLFPIRSELAKSSKKRMNKVTNKSTGFSFQNTQTVTASQNKVPFTGIEAIPAIKNSIVG